MLLKNNKFMIVSWEDMGFMTRFKNVCDLCMLINQHL